MACFEITRTLCLKGKTIMRKRAALKGIVTAFLLAGLTLTGLSCGKNENKTNIPPSDKGVFLDITVKAGKAEKFVSDRPYDENKEDVSIILVTGQSNFERSAGYIWQLGWYNEGKSDVYPDAPVKVPEGIAYSFNVNETLTALDAAHDMNYISDPEKGNMRVGGVTPSFAVRWNELTGSKVVFIQAAVGGTGIHEWVPHPVEYICIDCKHHGKNTCYSNAVKAFKSAFRKLSEEYNIVYTGYIFNQGEHDEGRSPNCTVNDGQSYYDAYMKMHNGFKKDLGLDFGGISVVRADKEGASVRHSRSYTIARGGQYRLTNNESDIFMLSMISETCGDSKMDIRGSHYVQSTFTEMGIEMAENLHASLGLSDAKEYDGITVYGNGGHILAAYDKNGVLTDGKGVVEERLSSGGVQVRFNVLGGAYTVDYTVNVNGKANSKYIDDFGQIDWDTLKKDTGCDEITIRVTVE